MAKKKLLEDIKTGPGRFYRAPSDVTRDRRFDDGERLAILKAWAETDAGRAKEARAAIADIERRIAPKDHAAE